MDGGAGSQLSGQARTAKWMVGDRLASVLHLGDSSLAYLLADQGHDVVVAGAEVVGRRSDELQYVRTEGDRLPFASSVFDAVVVPHFEESPLALSEYARVLRPDGLVSALSHRYDESIPWMRRLREVIGMRDLPAATSTTLLASGLFGTPEGDSNGSWERLDLDQFLQFARANRHPSVPDAALNQVRALFDEYAAHTGTLQLRHETTCLRARVDKSQLDDEPTVAETVLLDFR